MIDKDYNINLILAVNEDWAIGNNNDLLYFFPTDLKHFVSKTKGKTIVMGRNTWHSLPKTLPKRKHIVLTSDKNKINPISDNMPDIIISDINDILEMSLKEEIWVIGGSLLYKELVKYAKKVELTKILDSIVEYDTDVKDLEKELINFNIVNNVEVEDMDKISNRNIIIKFLTYER